MTCLDISSTFFTEEKINQLYSELDINTDARTVQLHTKHPFHYVYRSPNQITTIKTEDNQRRVLTYNSAQNYYKSEKAGLMSGPELADKVRRSDEPTTDSWVSDEDYKKHEEAWNKCKVDVAFKANWLKFMQNKDLAYKLLLTGNRLIVSTEATEVSWGKPSWAAISNKMLMIIREDLRRQAMN